MAHRRLSVRPAVDDVIGLDAATLLSSSGDALPFPTIAAAAVLVPAIG